MSISCGLLSHLKLHPGKSAALQRIFCRRNPILAVSLCLLVPLCGSAQDLANGADEQYQLHLEQAVAAVLKFNPELAALAVQAQGMRTMPSQAAALPDPVLSLNAMNLPTNSFDLGQEAMTQMQVALSQTFPFPGKRKQQRLGREHEVLAADALLAERRMALVGETRATWWQLYSIDRAIQIIAQNQELMRDFVAVAETKYRVGNGLQQDVLLAQLELSRLLDRQLKLDGQRRMTQAKLNSMMNRPSNWRIELPLAAPSTALPQLPNELQLLRQAGSNRSLIDAQKSLVAAARADLESVKKDRYPVFKVGVGYGFRQGLDPLRGKDRADLLSVMLSVSLPIYSGGKQQKAVEKQAHEISRRKFMLNDTLRRVESSVSTYVAGYESARDQVVLLETAIIPQAEQTVASMLAGYQVNQVEFFSVVNTQITLFNARINYWESLSRAKQALASLAAAVGTEALYE